MSSKFDYRVKILMLGNSHVGKSSLLLRFSDNTFSSEYSVTLGVEYKQKIISLKSKETEKNNNVSVQVWDTAGQERFRTITSAYYRGVEGIVLTFDVTDEASF